jgi:hypothetical protein
MESMRYVVEEAKIFEFKRLIGKNLENKRDKSPISFFPLYPFSQWCGQWNV